MYVQAILRRSSSDKPNSCLHMVAVTIAPRSNKSARTSCRMRGRTGHSGHTAPWPKKGSQAARKRLASSDALSTRLARARRSCSLVPESGAPVARHRFRSSAKEAFVAVVEGNAESATLRIQPLRLSRARRASSAQPGSTASHKTCVSSRTAGARHVEARAAAETAATSSVRPGLPRLEATRAMHSDGSCRRDIVAAEVPCKLGGKFLYGELWGHPRRTQKKFEAHRTYAHGPDGCHTPKAAGAGMTIARSSGTSQSQHKNADEPFFGTETHWLFDVS